MPPTVDMDLRQRRTPAQSRTQKPGGRQRKDEKKQWKRQRQSEQAANGRIGQQGPDFCVNEHLAAVQRGKHTASREFFQGMLVGDVQRIGDPDFIQLETADSEHKQYKGRVELQRKQVFDCQKPGGQ